MKKDRHYETAVKFGILDRCEKLEAELLQIEGVSSVEFDLDGWLDNLNQVILLLGYDIDVRREDYYEARRALKMAAITTMLDHNLPSSGDPIEDYGEHFYFVRNCSIDWLREKIERQEQMQFLDARRNANPKEVVAHWASTMNPAIDFMIATPARYQTAAIRIAEYAMACFYHEDNQNSYMSYLEGLCHRYLPKYSILHGSLNLEEDDTDEKWNEFDDVLFDICDIMYSTRVADDKIPNLDNYKSVLDAEMLARFNLAPRK